MTEYDADLIIVGAGPVGMCAAIEAASRGKTVLIFERREAGDPAGAKCNTVAARTMETFRGFGLAEKVAQAGLPDDFPTDVIYATAIAGSELTRLALPARAERGAPRFGDSSWRCAEPMVRVSQIYLEPILQEKMRSLPGVLASFGAEVLAVSQDAVSAAVTVRTTEGTEARFVAPYLMGCDGGSSLVRKTIGAKLIGDVEIARTRSTLIRAPGLNALFGDRRKAWMSWVVNAQVKGILVAIDGRDTWLAHRALPRGETDFETVDLDGSLRALLGVDETFSYDVLHHEDWVGRRMVASRMREGRVFIAGDAAHLWVPFAGYGMNAGIADGMNAVWLISNVLDGWADTAMLDAYEAERHPITEQVSRHAMQNMLDTLDALGNGPVPRAFSQRYNPAGAVMRAYMARKLAPINAAQFLPEGLNFGYYYENSPIIVPDSAEPPGFTMDSHTPSTVPGCRMPHFKVDEGSVYDLLGPVYTLFRFNPAKDVSRVLDGASSRNLPLKLLDMPARAGDPAYTHDLLIARRDQHVAWRGNELPADADALLDRLCGRGAV